MNSANSPLISVVMITYNHENFIQQAIEGVLMQDFSGEIELIIANDCSTDNTDAVIQKMIKHHFRGSLIKYTSHSINLGMMNNFIWALKQTQGKFIALCEGDDYWTDPKKLQKQVAFLDANEDVVLTAHQVSILCNDSSNRLYCNYENGFKIVSMDAKINHWNIPTLSVLFRKGNLELPTWYQQVKSGDFFLYNLLAVKGSFYFIDQNMGVYRDHSGGVSKYFDRIEWINSNLRSMKNLNFDFRYKLAIKNFRYKSFIELHELYNIKKNKISSVFYILRAFVIFPNGILNFKHLLRMIKDIFNIN